MMNETAAYYAMQNRAAERERWAKVLARPANYKPRPAPAKLQGLLARVVKWVMQ